MPRSVSNISRAFRSWLGERDPHLSLGIVLDHEGAQELTFSLAGWPELEGSLTPTGLDIAAMRDGECWDLLLSLDVDPVEVGGGWSCSICDAEGKHERSRTLEALWRDHFFEPLEVWIVEKLARGRELEFHRQGEATWARLVDGERA